MLASTGRPLTPGDILVLVRSRGELASLIVARLFSAGVPVAGVDRLHLHEPLAVQDLLAAVRFAVQPNDDLNLACLLVSPLIGWDQEQLRDARLRPQGPLVARAARAGGESDIRRRARGARPSCCGSPTSPRRRASSRRSCPARCRAGASSTRGSGMAARDPIDELMNSALEFERNETASLDRFLAWFSRGTVEVQRDPGQPANEVRVMTVHGAKGLEAPVVILADATADPARLGRTPLTRRYRGRRRRESRRCCARRRRSAARRSTRSSPSEEQRDLEEHMRLLYVALTRAADRLIVSGVEPKARKDGADPRPANCWHRIVEQALAPHRRRAGGRAMSRCATATARRRGRSAPKDKVAAAARSPCPTGRARRRRPKRARRGRSRRPRSRSTTKRAAAERGDARGRAARDADPPVARAAAGGRAERAAGAADRWLERSAGVADAGAARRDRRPGLRHPVRSAVSPLVRPGLARRSAARRDLARRAGDRRHRRPPAGRGRARLGDRLQDRASARDRRRRSQRRIARRWRPMPRRCG